MRASVEAVADLSACRGVREAAERMAVLRCRAGPPRWSAKRAGAASSNAPGRPHDDRSRRCLICSESVDPALRDVLSSGRHSSAGLRRGRPVRKTE